LLSGLAWGAVIGAVSALTAELINQAKAWLLAKHNADELAQAVLRQTAAWDPHRTKLDEVTAATVAVYNAKLALAQFMARDEGQAIRDSIANLEAHNRVLLQARQTAAIPLEDRWQRKMLENSLAIEENKRQLEEWQRLMALTPQTLERVQAALSKQVAAEPVTVDLGDTYEVWQRHYKMLGEIQAQRGQQILDERRAQMAEEQRLILAKSTFEIEIAQVTAENERAINQVRLAEAQATIQGQLQLLGTLAALSTSKSKALFLVAQAAAVAQSLVAAHAAAAQALASPPGPPTTIPLAASVLKWGYANAALAAAVRFASGSVGGGGGGIGGGGGGSSSLGQPGAATTNTEEQPKTVNITVHFENTAIVDSHTKDQIVDALIPALGQALGERSGVAGNYRLQIERR
jgi:hypothetical protein